MKWTFASIVLVPRGGWAAPPSAMDRQRIFAWASQAGFAGIELSPRWLDFHRLSPQERREVGAEIRQAGLQVSGLNISRAIVTRSDRAAEHLERLHRGVEIASEWEAPTVTVSLSMPTLPDASRPVLRGQDIPEDEHRRSAELLAEVARRAQPLGVALSLELHDDGLLDSAEACLRLAAWMDQPNVGFHPDLGNIVRGGGPLPDWESTLRRLAPRANAWSVKNYRAGRPVPVWNGDIDHPRAVAIMKEAGFAGWVGIESYFGDDVLGLQRDSLAYLRALAERGET